MTWFKTSTLLLFFSGVILCIHADSQREGFFNLTSYVSLFTPLSLTKHHIGLSFRSCTGGQLFSQSSPTNSFSLEVRPEGLNFIFSQFNRRYETRLKANLLDNEWHTVNILYRLGNLTLSVGQNEQVIANATYNSEILKANDVTSDPPGQNNALLIVGNGFSGCILEGPSIILNSSQMTAYNVEWGPCPLPNTPCGVVDHCAHDPCMSHGTCIPLHDRYFCQCTSRYTGSNCQIDNGPPCDRTPCRNGGRCVEDKMGEYSCVCHPGFGGKDCELELTTHLCETNPCLNNATCRPAAAPNYYQCICTPGYTGRDCDININECLSNPCLHGGTCIDGVNNYTCFCGRTGYTGQRCELNINECESNPCLNNGVCFDTYGSYTCQCPPGFGGHNCHMKMSECSSNPCTTPNTICIDTTGGHQCVCKAGFKGTPPNCVVSEGCAGLPCLNGATCTTLADSTFKCTCPPGYTGTFCQINIDECFSNPCQNGGTCFDGVNSYICNCTAEFMGPNCEHKYDACLLKPCLNGGTCVPKGADRREYYCECPVGFEGLHCENNIDDCLHKWCPPDKVCVDGINSYECRCKNGLQGPNCTLDIPHCSSNPCAKGSNCTDSPGNFTCVCAPGYTGRLCDQDIDECKVYSKICNNGVCFNNDGGYQCFCTPGFSGDNCDVDFDECLSHPCQNGATCENKINAFFCVCPPGFTGADCSININECESNPCVSGATCVDEIATFSCICPAGLTGKLCETNIDDCESNPCQNNGVCIDGLNSYVCNCTDTGFSGDHCENNIDECASSPCQNGGTCKDLINGYMCLCHPAYEGINCEVDRNECLTKPCKNGGTCLERSNLSYYTPEAAGNRTSWPPIFSHPFDYSTAHGFECLCLPGFTGTNCQIDINECESSPCRFGQCNDLPNGFQCVCDAGFEGLYCETETDECEKFKPCVHGTCIDRRADYFCQCNEKYGGKNCSVELTGCIENACLNNGTCKPYLEAETIQRFNCTCINGFHGPRCEQMTTMSMNGSAYVMVNTSREEGYDIQLRFKTTLPSGLLAIGKGPTFYILELNQGRLNLLSSLVNKWEGVFIGSGLNDTKWHKVFVAINSSHLVVSANEEQTIYPINMNEGANSSHTSFPTTYLGGTISYLRRLTHGPASFIGCVQDVMINGQWVLPEESGMEPVSFIGVEPGCKREPQCSPNPCHNGGHCTDLWQTFSCTCQRPYLGHTCQYNLTAATFGHENITDSIVSISVDQAARRAVRSILDISMFIRTRKSTGGIFYLGSSPDTVPYSEETVIDARLAKGELEVHIQFNATPEKYTVGGVRLDNGYNHLIQVVRNVTLVQVKINGTEYFRKTISASGQLDLQTLQLGGVPKEPDNFKGVIHDVQVSNGSRVMVVEFYPLDAQDLDMPYPLGKVELDPSKVLEGVVSDDSCVSEPCMHGGTCTVTWNDFNCLCTVGYKGKQCEDMEFCQVQDCPAGSECRNLNHGYECVANITLHNPPSDITGLHYRLVRGTDDEEEVALSEISVNYRSKTGGTLIQVGPDQLNRFLAASVFKDQVTVRWDLGEGTTVKTIGKELADGDWVTLTLQMLNDSTLKGTLVSPSSAEGRVYFTANFSLPAWHSLIMSSNITVGGKDKLVTLSERHMYTTFEGEHSNAVEMGSTDHPDLTTPLYRGCLGEIRVGGLLLPFFTTDLLNSTNSSAKAHFELIAGSSLGEQLGCSLCFDEECANGGVCKNATESYSCECEPGFSGDDCSEDINECLDSDCKNNSTCIDGTATYTCQCLPGWQGSLCDKEIDECASNPCQNGGTCKDHLARYECICSPDFVGDSCEQVKLVTCENQPCHNGAHCSDVINPATADNFTCHCREGFVGVYCKSAFCEVTPCENQGECTTSTLVPVCKCMPGYSGKLCQINIDECASNPCKNNGHCIDGVASFSCDCTDTGFSGSTCEMDINECASGTVDCGAFGECINTIGSFMCKCNDNYCGPTCLFPNPCYKETPCENGGQCHPNCEDKSDYLCTCAIGFGGKNCSEVPVYGSTNLPNVALIVGPILAILIIAGAISLTVFLMMARKKRATRGTYSPSSQEYSNPRVELDNVMKPPPEERLI